MKNNKGITLIALVVTIIVLLILAGVSIAMLTGENGILGKAKEASYTNALGAAKDEVGLIATDAVAEYYKQVYVKGNNTINANGGDLDDYIESVLNKAINLETDGVSYSYDNDNDKITLTYSADGHKVTSDTISNGKITWNEITEAD